MYYQREQTIKPSLFIKMAREMNISVFICLAFLVITLGVSTNLVYSQQEQVEPSGQQRQEQLITYVDPQGNYTLQYPQSWKVEYRKSVTPYDFPTTQFQMPDSVSLVSIEMSHTELTQKQFEDGFLIYYPLLLRERFDGIKVENKTFGGYEIDGYQAGSIVFTSPIEKTIGVSKVLFVSAILSDNQTISITYISSNENYNNNIQDVEAMIDSIRIEERKKEEREKGSVNDEISSMTFTN
jgi:hypothetical protein